MLVENNQFNQNDIISMKLTSGEEIIGRFIEQKYNETVVQKPMMIVPSQSGLGLMPWAFTLGENSSVPIKENSISAKFKTEENIKSQYVESTSGIKMPTSNNFS